MHVLENGQHVFIRMSLNEIFELIAGKVGPFLAMELTAC